MKAFKNRRGGDAMRRRSPRTALSFELRAKENLLYALEHDLAKMTDPQERRDQQEQIRDLKLEINDLTAKEKAQAGKAIPALSAS